MTPTTCNTEAGLLRDICERPFDDTPRLIYADWLEDHGSPERAEWIRLIWEYTQGKPQPARPHAEGRYRDLSNRLQELFNAEHHTARDLQDGFLADGHGYLTWDDMHSVVLSHLNSARWGFFGKGFVSAVACTCADWLAHGREIVLAQPVTEVKLTDKEPEKQGNDVWWWYASSDLNPIGHRQVLPADWFEGGGVAKYFYSLAEAWKWAGGRAVAFARQQADLPELTWPTT